MVNELLEKEPSRFSPADSSSQDAWHRKSRCATVLGPCIYEQGWGHWS